MMKNGFLYQFIKTTLDSLKYLNLVELFKTVGKNITSQKATEYSRISVDAFIVLKWFFLLLLWIFDATNFWLTLFVWYLIFTNIYTYFYYHIWTDDALDTSGHDNDRIRRRFVNLLLAIAYSDFCFAFLYHLPYASNFKWTSENATGNSIWFSISNSLAANYDAVKPLTNFGNTVAMTQLILTFIFVTIIISRSIPQKN